MTGQQLALMSSKLDCSSVHAELVVKQKYTALLHGKLMALLVRSYTTCDVITSFMQTRQPSSIHVKRLGSPVLHSLLGYAAVAMNQLHKTSSTAIDAMANVYHVQRLQTAAEETRPGKRTGCSFNSPPGSV